MGKRSGFTGEGAVLLQHQVHSSLHVLHNVTGFCQVGVWNLVSVTMIQGLHGHTALVTGQWALRVVHTCAHLGTERKEWNVQKR